jgi:Arylsulfotransferase (ASST)
VDTDILTQGAKGDGNDFYTLPPANVFHWQHHVRVNNTRGPVYKMTLFADQNSEADTNGTLASSGMTFAVDTNRLPGSDLDRSATLISNFADPTNPIYVDSQGSHEILSNGKLLLGY